MTFERNIEIKRLHEKERWPVGTIAKHFQIHHSTVTRVLEGKEPPKTARPSQLDPYKDFIRETLKTYPNIKASRILGMIQERGYPGQSRTIVGNFVRSVRPKPPKEAFLRLRMPPGEQAQVDWAHFGRWNPGDPKSRKLMGFVMTLSYSRLIFLKFFLGESESHFQQGHIDAFEFFGGVPRSVLIDNLKTGVTERIDSLVRFNESYLVFARHFGFRPLAANIRRGNEKGRVERSIRYIRENFIAAREKRDLGVLNKQAEEWCLLVSAKRPWPQERSRTVFDAFGEEKLMPLPQENRFVFERKMVRVGKTPYIRFDCNDYSVPAKFVSQFVEVQACTEWVHIVESQERVTTHKRSYEKGRTLEHPEHFTEVLNSKQRAKKEQRSRKSEPYNDSSQTSDLSF